MRLAPLARPIASRSCGGWSIIPAADEVISRAMAKPISERHSRRAGVPVLVDTGPLVALFDPSDRDHSACTTALARLGRTRLLTTLAVLTEATYLLAFSRQAQRAVIQFVASGAVELIELSGDHLARAVALMEQYEDLPMDFADATLVAIAESERTQMVFTLDRRDFSIYRAGRKPFRVLPE